MAFLNNGYFEIPRLLSDWILKHLIGLVGPPLWGTKTLPKLKLGKIGVHSNNAQNHSSILLEVISGHY